MPNRKSILSIHIIIYRRLYRNDFSIYLYRFQYEFIASEGIINLNENTSANYSAIVTNPPVVLDLDYLAHVINKSTNFTVGIRIKTASGHRSSFSQLDLIEIHPVYSSFTWTPLKIIGIAAAVILLFTILICVIRKFCCCK